MSDAFLNEPLGVLGTPNVGFLALIVIGGLAGWIASIVAGVRQRLLTNVLIGVAGSWLGSELADVFGVAVEGSLGHFIAALLGSILIVSIWQRLQRGSRRDDFGGRYPTI